MTKAEAQKKANQLKAIENGLTTLIEMSKKADFPVLTKTLGMARLITESYLLGVETAFNVEASKVLPFKKK